MPTLAKVNQKQITMFKNRIENVKTVLFKKEHELAEMKEDIQSLKSSLAYKEHEAKMLEKEIVVKRMLLTTVKTDLEIE